MYKITIAKRRDVGNARFANSPSSLYWLLADDTIKDVTSIIEDVCSVTVSEVYSKDKDAWIIMEAEFDSKTTFNKLKLMEDYRIYYLTNLNVNYEYLKLTDWLTDENKISREN